MRIRRGRHDCRQGRPRSCVRHGALSARRWAPAADPIRKACPTIKVTSWPRASSPSIRPQGKRAARQRAFDIKVMPSRRDARFDRTCSSSGGARETRDTGPRLAPRLRQAQLPQLVWCPRLAPSSVLELRPSRPVGLMLRTRRRGCLLRPQGIGRGRHDQLTRAPPTSRPVAARRVTAIHLATLRHQGRLPASSTVARTFRRSIRGCGETGSGRATRSPASWRRARGVAASPRARLLLYPSGRGRSEGSSLYTDVRATCAQCLTPSTPTWRTPCSSAARFQSFVLTGLSCRCSSACRSTSPIAAALRIVPELHLRQRRHILSHHTFLGAMRAQRTPTTFRRCA